MVKVVGRLKLREELLAITLLSLVAFLGTLAFRLSIPAIAFYVRESLGATALSVGLLTSSFFAARAVTATTAGILIDRLGLKRILNIVVMLFITHGAVVVLYSMFSDIVHITMLRAVQGILNGISWVTIQVSLGILVPEKLRGRAYSIYFTSGSLGGVLGNNIYSLLAYNPLIQVLAISLLTFMLAGLLTMALLLIFKSRLRGVVRGSSKAGFNYLSVIKCLRDVLLVIIVALGLSMFTSFIRGDLSYVYVSESLGIGRDVATNLIAFASLTALILGYMFSWMADKYNDLIALRISTFTAMLGIIMLSMPYVVTIFLGIFMFSSGNSAVIAIARRVAVSSKVKGLAVGVINTMSNIGMVSGSLIIGYLYDVIGLSPVISQGIIMFKLPLIAGIPTLIALVMTLALKRGEPNT